MRLAKVSEMARFSYLIKNFNLKISNLGYSAWTSWTPWPSIEVV